MRLKIIFNSPLTIKIFFIYLLIMGNTFESTYAQFSYIDQFGGAGTSISLNDVRHLDIDQNGFVYMADFADNRVKVFDASGKFVRQFGKEGYGNGEFKGCNGLTLDGSNNIYVTDYYNNRVQKFDQYGNFLMKFSLKSRADGATNEPYGIHVDKNGNIYVAMSRRGRIEVRDPAGKFLRDIGKGGLTENGSLYIPRDVTVDDNLNVYVIDEEDRLTKFNSSGAYVAKIDGGGYGSANGQFWSPQGIDIGSDGKIYVSESWNHRVQIFTSSLTYLSKFGSMGSGNTQFDFPMGMALDKNDNIYVADPKNKRVQKFTSTGSYSKTFSSSESTPGSLNDPKGIVIKGNNVYVADYGNERIQQYNLNGDFVKSHINNSNQLVERIGQVFDITTDNSGNFLTTTPFYRNVNKYNASFKGISLFGSTGLEAFRLDKTTGLATANNGDVWVADKGSHEIKIYSAAGEFKKKIGGFGTGTGKFNEPNDVSKDASGNMYVADYGNDRIQVFAADGRYLRRFGVPGSGNGQLNAPAFVAVDGDGNVYVSDNNNHRIQKFDKDGNFISAIGEQGKGNAQFQGVTGITVASNGNVYVVDNGNSRVQVFSQTTPPPPGTISGFAFQDPATNNTITGYGNVTANTTVKVSELSTKLNFKALFSGAVDRVDWTFSQDGNEIQARSDNSIDFNLYDNTYFTVADGIYTLSATPYNSGVKGTTKSITITITSTNQPEFLIASDVSGSQVITQGSSEDVIINLSTVNGHSKTVTFSTSGSLPAGVSVSFSPTSRSGSGSVNMTITASASAAIGQKTITVEATDGSITKSIDVAITVEEPAIPDFSISASAPSIVASSSEPGYITLQITRLNGFAGTINFSHSGTNLTGITTSYDPSSLSGAGSTTTVKIEVGATATSNSTFITFTASSGGLQRSVKLPIDIYNEAPKKGYSISVVPNPVQIQQGTSGKVKFSLTRTGGYTGDITVRQDFYPVVSGFTASSTPGSFTGNTTEVEVNIDVAGSVSVGTYNNTIITNGDGLSFSEGGTTFNSIEIQVISGPVPPDYSIVVNPNNLNISHNSSVTTTLSVATLGGFSNGITFNTINLPSGVTSNFSPSSLSGDGTSTLTFNADASVVPGTYAVQVNATSGGTTKTETIYLKVEGNLTAGPDFALSASPANVTVAPGASVTSDIELVPIDGFSGTVNLSASGMPGELTAGFSQNSLSTSGTSRLTLTADAAIAPSTYSVTVTGVSGGNTRTAIVNVTVEDDGTGEPTFSLAATSPSLSIPQGESATSQISFTAANGFTDDVQLSIDQSNLPVGVTAAFDVTTIAAGSSAVLTFNASRDAAPGGPVNITVTGTSGSIVKTILLAVTIEEVNDPDFSLVVNPNRLSIDRGVTAEATVQVEALYGFSGDVNLTMTNNNPDITATLSANAITTAGNTTLTIEIADLATVGDNKITITGTADALIHSDTLYLTITVPLIAKNQFSPNGDLLDDTWFIENIDLMPQYEVVVFNRAGQEVFQSKAYQNDWDGTSNGKTLLPTTYFYVIRNEKGENVESGSVNLIR